MSDPVVNSPELKSRWPRVAAALGLDAAPAWPAGGQLYISRHGETLVDCGFGEARPGVPMSADHHIPWLSAGKPVAAAGWMRLIDQGRAQLDEPIAVVIPEFAAEGKAAVTMRHLLTHTAGLREADPDWPNVEWHESVARVAAVPMEADWTLGRTAGYHVSSTWFILGEAIARMSGQAFETWMRANIFEPSGMSNSAYSVSPDETFETANMVNTWQRTQGEWTRLDWHLPPRIHRPSPGSSLRGPIRELGRFYEMLLQAGCGIDGAHVLSSNSVAAMTARHRVGEFDRTLGHIVDCGLGVLIDSNQYGVDTVPYGYGRDCSPRTFGHGGSQMSIGFCDPEASVVVAWAINGRPGEGYHQRRNRAINDAIWTDLANV